MEPFTYSVPCLFGLEGLVGEELRRLKLDGVAVENGRVRFTGGWEAMAAANIRMRMGERVLLCLGSFPARSFEELFQGVRALPLEDFIPKTGKFPVKGHCLNSQLHSVPDCQAIVKKAAVERLGRHYGLSWLPETGELYQLQFSIMKDRVEIYLDTSGAGLHKRGYRAVGNDAPLRETLAAAMVELARFRGRDFFWDPFCGSGTIVIEAALTALNRAPGLNRSFSAQRWPVVPETVWEQTREAARAAEFRGEYRILGSDNDPDSLNIAISNAKKAGVGKLIRFEEADATRRDLPAERGVIVCNPPYGERMMEQRSAQRLYQALGRHLKYADNWDKCIISSEPEFEHYFGRRADKKRKLYNGMIQCNLYQYFKGDRRK
ncbi:MAG: class I SAM-dependent RNA methyltransferase [Oscillospiraceae bacterium]|jgi:putative N6-adenine-specific DNA methylase|nr:class I SAM-dependent RNA methyltransferase [Oscillospiraceae bacterium]